ncbi:MAG: (2Fe-2S)-binding protein [Anaerolineales bacterium]|nr:(2Fe-2S)-binding protein [Anaerolineales bacterium]
MPQLTVNGQTIEVEAGTRLVLAIEAAGIKIGHRCGGNARCTTCRVEFQAGEPTTMTQAEYAKLKERELLGQVRLACQCVCEQDMSVTPLQTAETMPQWNGDTGPAPAPTVTPDPTTYSIEQLKAAA